MKYSTNETAMLILDFADEIWENYAWLVEDETLRRAVDGMKEIGVENIQLRCKTWQLAQRVLDSFGETDAMNITCVVPYAGMPVAIGINANHANLALRLPDAKLFVIGKDFERLKYLQERLRDQIGFVAVIVPVNKHNLEYVREFASELYKATGQSVIFDPEIDPFGRNCDPVKLSWQELDMLYSRLIELNRSANRHDAFLMNLGLLPARLLVEHPCNCYVCYGQSCHSQKSNFPRRLSLLADGTVLPISRFTNKNLAIGNIKNHSIRDLMMTYVNGEQHDIFRSLSKKIFIEWVQTCPYRVVPWDDLFVASSYEIQS